jgi:hypothetical protein
MANERKVVAKLYRATNAEKRLCGDNNTDFLVGFEGSMPETWERIAGYGSTAAKRKAAAIKRFLAHNQDR